MHHKTNEIPRFAPLLDTIGITGMLITADCLHTQRKHACYLHQRGADFVFCVKDNQPNLFAVLGLPTKRSEPQHQRGDGEHAGAGDTARPRTVRRRPRRCTVTASTQPWRSTCPRVDRKFLADVIIDNSGFTRPRLIWRSRDQW